MDLFPSEKTRALRKLPCPDVPLALAEWLAANHPVWYPRKPTEAADAATVAFKAGQRSIIDQLLVAHAQQSNVHSRRGGS